MCIAIVSRPATLAVSALFEHILLDIDQDGPRTVEVYDLFFVLRDEKARTLLLLSPHVLLDAEALQAETSYDLNADPYSDLYYSTVGALQRTAEPETLSVELHSRHTDLPEPISIQARVLHPAITLPPQIASRPQAQALVSQLGTPLEIVLPPGLTVGTPYVFRLRIRPRALLDIPQKMPVPDPLTAAQGAWWEQPLGLFSPYAVYKKVRSLLHTVRAFGTARNGAPRWRELLDREGYDCCDLLYHRIALLIPPNASLSQYHPLDNVRSLLPIVVAPPGLAQPRATYQWEAGMSLFPSDAPRTALELLIRHLRAWGGQGKTKEQLTAALHLPHDNCSLLVDALVSKSVANETSPGSALYCIPGSLDDSLARIDEILEDATMRERFRRTGFSVTYFVKYAVPRP